MQQGGTSVTEKAKEAGASLKEEVKQVAERGKEGLKSVAGTAKEVAEKGKEKLGDPSKPMRIAISSPRTPEHKVANPLALHHCWCHRRLVWTECAAV